MTREECENQILEKLKEIKDIVRENDKSEELYLSMAIMDDYMGANNAFWETNTPINFYN